MKYKLESFANGKVSVKNPILGESMHSTIGPWEEANLIYVGQSQLEKLIQTTHLEPLIVFDVGLGIGANAFALISEYEKLTRETQNVRDLHIHSFENDLEGLKFAIENLTHFDFLEKFPNILDLIKKRFLPPEDTYSSKKTFNYRFKEGTYLFWHLYTGDFIQEINGRFPVPELVYFDFYSPKSLPALWSFKIFKRLFELATSGVPHVKETTLLTYSTSTWVRSAMILAGFKVGSGIQTSAKLETTVASTTHKTLLSPLGKTWLEHLERSGKPLPSDHPFQTDFDAIQKIKGLLEAEVD
jgi:tRNA U34 5-methylaminomethyl-2-thiouridine-forming methyltransferase MnmC